jgi:DNA-binding transcriptional ArsR family regulator
MDERPAEPASQRPVAGDIDIASVGALVADPARCRILLALSDGRALPAKRLAADAGVSAATASSHLARLTKAGLLTVEAHGRYRYYRLVGPEVGDLIEALERFAPAVPVRSLRQSHRVHALREARTCYDHLAGRLGVELMRAMIDRGHLVPGEGAGALATGEYVRDVDYSLTESGRALLDELGVRIPAHRWLVRHHIDSTEQRPHLSGALGRGLLERFVELGWVRRAEATRAVRVTATGRQGFAGTFGIHLET